MLVLIGGFVAFVWYDYNRPEPDTPVATVEKPKSGEKVDTASLDAENQEREQDARAVTYGAGNFYRANAYAYPTAYANGAFTGAPGTKPQATKLTYYKTVVITTGAQQPVKTDEIRFVTNAVCAQSLSATVASSDSYAYVVQYSVRLSDGSFSPQCLRL
jgi:hypothetical protein